MAFIPNGSGLWIPDNTFRPRSFSVPDGTGYIRNGGAGKCIHTGFATNDDRISFPAPGGSWNVRSAGYWTLPPTSVANVSANASISAWMTATAIGDQWCAASVTTLTEAGNTGAGIGVMVRVQGTGNGYYGMVAKFNGAYRFEAGKYTGTLSAIINVSTGGVGSVVLTAIGNTISFYSGSIHYSGGPPSNLNLLGSFSDSTYTTGVPGAIASSGSNGHPDTVMSQTSWIAAEIGGC